MPGREPLRNGVNGFNAEFKRLVPALYEGVAKFASKTTAALSPLLEEGTEAAPPPSAPTAKREAMSEWREAARRTLIPVAAFSVFVNLLMLTLPIYLFQLSDRVLTSRSHDTLLMLSVVAIALHRRPVASRYRAPASAGPCSPPEWRPFSAARSLASIVTTARASDGANLQALRSLHQVQGVHLEPGDAAPVRRAAGAALFRRRVPHSPRSRFHRDERRPLADRDRRHQPTSDGKPAWKSEPARVEGRHRRRGARAQFAGHQRHGHAERKHSALGPRAGTHPQRARRRARGQRSGSAAPRQIRAAHHPDRHAWLSAPTWRCRATSPAA